MSDEHPPVWADPLTILTVVGVLQLFNVLLMLYEWWTR